MSTTSTTPRALIRAWVEDYVAGHPEVSPEAIATAARERWVGDPELAHALVEWALGEVVRAEARRATTTPDRVPLAGGRSITRSALEQRAVGGPWAEWAERYRMIDADGQLVGLPDMTREHLIDALAERKAIARDAIVSARFLDALVRTVGDGERVRDVLTPDDLARLHRQSEGRR